MLNTIKENQEKLRKVGKKMKKYRTVASINKKFPKIKN